jgi:hypothetical protein
MPVRPGGSACGAEAGRVRVRAHSRRRAMSTKADREGLLGESGTAHHYAPVWRREEEAAFQPWSICAWRAWPRVSLG